MKIAVLIITALLASATGCSMCCGPFDYDYPAFGGKHPRADRSHGRVGSILSDPMTMISGPSADSNLTAPTESLNTAPDDLLDTDIEDLDAEDPPSDSLDNELERIEPLRNDNDGSGADSTEDNTTASSRWRPRPLRSRIR
jgi:hypothetical protein